MKLFTYFFLAYFSILAYSSCKKDQISEPIHEEPIDTIDLRDNLIGFYNTKVLRFNWFDTFAFDSIYFDSIFEVQKVDTSQIKIQILNRVLWPCAIPDCYHGYLRPGNNMPSAYFFENDSIYYKDSEGSLGGGTIWQYRGRKQ